MEAERKAAEEEAEAQREADKKKRDEVPYTLLLFYYHWYYSCSSTVCPAREALKGTKMWHAEDDEMSHNNHKETNTVGVPQ